MGRWIVALFYDGLPYADGTRRKVNLGETEDPVIGLLVRRKILSDARQAAETTDRGLVQPGYEILCAWLSEADALGPRLQDRTSMMARMGIAARALLGRWSG